MEQKHKLVMHIEPGPRSRKTGEEFGGAHDSLRSRTHLSGGSPSQARKI